MIHVHASPCPKCGTMRGVTESGRLYCPRGADCPPGAEARQILSWGLSRVFLPLLRELPAMLFTVKELKFLLGEYHSGIEDGFILRDLYEKHNTIGWKCGPTLTTLEGIQKSVEALLPEHSVPQP